MSIIGKIYRWITKISEIIPVICLVLLVTLTFLNVILRYLFNAPIPWAEEIEALLYTFMVFFGLSITHRLGTAVGVDIVTSLFPKKVERVVSIFSTMLTLLLWICITYLGIQLALRTRNSYTSYLNIPYRYIYWFVPISGTLDIIQLVRRLFLMFTNKDYGKKTVTDPI